MFGVTLIYQLNVILYFLCVSFSIYTTIIVAVNERFHVTFFPFIKGLPFSHHIETTNEDNALCIMFIASKFVDFKPRYSSMKIIGGKT